MSAHISDTHLKKLYRALPGAVTISQLPRLASILRAQELDRLANDALGRLPRDADEAQALGVTLLNLPTTTRLSPRCIALLTHCEDMAKGVSMVRN